MGADGKTYHGTAYPVYEFVAYGGSRLCCQVNRFGTAEVFPKLPQPSELKLKQGVEEMVIVAGIVDAPIPIPQVNIADFPFEDSDPNFGTITYSGSETHSMSHSVSNSFTAGFKTDGQTLKGWGPAWTSPSTAGWAGSTRTARRRR